MAEPGRVKEIPYDYFGGSAKVFDADEPEVILSGPSGTGKSQAICELLNLICKDHDNLRVLIARRTRESMTQSVLVTLQRIINPRDARWYGNSEWRYHTTGARIIAVGLNEPSRLMSSDLDLVYVQEATEIEEGDWEMLITRLRNGVLPNMRILGDCNPQGPNHWILKRAQAGKLRMIETAHEDNPSLYDHAAREFSDAGRAYISKLDALTGVRLKRLRHGLWVAAEGMIYEEFDRDIHLRPASDFYPGDLPPRDWTRWWSIDFGYTHPFCWQAWAQDPETGTLLRFAELYHTKMLVEDVCQVVHDWMYRVGEDFPGGGIICDHDAEGRATLEKHWGVGTIAAKKSVSVGIQAVKQRFANQARLSSHGVVYLRDCALTTDADLVDSKQPTSTEDEVELYVWKDGIKDSEPVKECDHGQDASRYLVMAVDKGSIWTPDEIAKIGQRMRGEIPRNPETWLEAEKRKRQNRERELAVARGEDPPDEDVAPAIESNDPNQIADDQARRQAEREEAAAEANRVALMAARGLRG
jgi:phage terminase large subunit